MADIFSEGMSAKSWLQRIALEIQEMMENRLRAHHVGLMRGGRIWGKKEGGSTNNRTDI